MRTTFRLFWLIWIGLQSALLVADEKTQLPISGRIFSDFYFPTTNPQTNPLPQASASGWLAFDPKLGDFSQAKFLLSADQLANQVNTQSNAQTDTRIRLREAYVEYSKESIDLRVGQQIIPWGKSDVFNPTDYLSAKDYTFFNPDEEVKRLGAPSILFKWIPQQGSSPFNLTAVVTPVFQQSLLLISPSELPTGVTLLSPSKPTATFYNMETALKADYIASSWDASISVFRGWNHLPEFGYAGFDAATQSVALVPVFHRLLAAGGDFSIALSKWILRGETAYFRTENADGTQPLIEPSHWDSVLGVERPLGDDWRIQYQFLVRRFFAWTPPNQAGGTDPISLIANPQIASTNALLLGYQDPTHLGSTFRVSYSKSSSPFATELFIWLNLTGGDYFVRPKVDYAWTDALKTSIGIEYYAGPPDRIFGALKGFDSAFCEAKYLF